MEQVDAAEQEWRDIMDGTRPVYQPITTHQCYRCKEWLQAKDFNFNNQGDRTQSCTSCLKEKARQEREVRQHQKEAARKRFDEGASDEEGSVPSVGKSAVPLGIGWPQLLKSVSEAEGDTADVCLWKVTIGKDDMIGEVKDPNLLSRAIAQEFWEVTKYRMVYKDMRKQKNSAVSTFRFYCSQNEKEQKAPTENPAKKRRRMKRFPCGGLLQIQINADDMSVLEIRYDHRLPHVQYSDISLPEEAQKYIRDHKDKTPGDLYSQLKIRYGKDLGFTQKQVHACWTSANERVWKLHTDQLQSAAMVLSRHTADNVERVPLPDLPGVDGFAFALSDVLNERGDLVHEVGMDSTWKTNSLGYELYAFVAEANGRALPLLFMFIQTDQTALEHSKTAMIARCLQYLMDKCSNVKFALSDKDQSEINAVQQVMSPRGVKHQLCYWHVIRYLADRLADNTKPRPYYPSEAYARFAFIDPTWGPPLPKDTAPRPGLDTEAQVEDVAEITLESAYSASLQRRASSKLVEFCPRQHRGALEDIHRRALCMHPSIPSAYHNHRYLTAHQIHSWITQEAYEFCKRNDLTWTWAYLWNQWYQPSQWKLWARSACNDIPRIRTTMIVESLWRVIKRKYLIDFNKPRLDLAIHLILINALPNAQLALQQLRGDFRPGRGIIPTGWQTDFMKEWRDLSKTDAEREKARPTGQVHRPTYSLIHASRDRTWVQDIDAWTCSCPAYLLSRFLMCKHLVRMVNSRLLSPEMDEVPLDVFDSLRRNHSPPYYRILGIHEPEIDPGLSQMVVEREVHLLSTSRRCGLVTVRRGVAASTAIDMVSIQSRTSVVPSPDTLAVDVINLDEFSDNVIDLDVADRCAGGSCGGVQPDGENGQRKGVSVRVHRADGDIDDEDGDQNDPGVTYRIPFQLLAGSPKEQADEPRHKTLDGPSQIRATENTGTINEPEDESANAFVSFSRPRYAALRKTFDLILEEIQPPKSLHPKYAKRLEEALKGVEEMGDALAKDNGRRVPATTWKDWDPLIAYRSK